MSASTSLRIIPLGGLGEVGKNMLAIECGEDIIVIDAGVMFPKADMLGVDLVLPNTTYLVERKERVRAILITHGHEDHIGALPFLLHDLRVPVYAPPLALNLVRVKLQEHRALSSVSLNEARPGDRITLGSVEAEYLHMCHSIPDACAIALHTPAGVVLHTGDFKIDHTPVDGRQADLQRVGELGQEGVLLLLSDSTYAELPGHTPSEQVVGPALRNAFAEAPGRVLVATFASLISRVQQVIDAALSDGRKVAFAGRSMVDNAAMAFAKGYLRAPSGTIVELQDLDAYPAWEQTVVLTGAQGEPTSVLVRIANQRHRDIKMRKDDTVVLSASTIPGNESAVARAIDNLVRQGARIVSPRSTPVHVHGHGSQEELKLMLSLVKPHYFVPVHGEYRMLAAHADLAREVGVEPSNVFVLEDGDVLEVEEAGAEVVERVPAGHVYVDGADRFDVQSVVLRDRQRLGNEGFVVVVAPIDSATGSLAGPIEVVTHGFAESGQAEELSRRASDLLANSLANDAGQRLELAEVGRLTREVLGAYFHQETGRRPMIIAAPVEV